MELLDFILVLSLRFFFFDFYLFKSVRNWLSLKGWVFNKLMKCSFCQGFWTGFFYYLIFIGFDYWSVGIGFICAILSYTYVVLTFKLSEEMERIKT